MKTIVKTISLTAAMLILTVNLSAGNPDKDQVRQEIQSQLKINVEKSETVTVVFTTDKTGKVNLAIAKTENKILKKAVEENFMKLELKHLVPDNCYSIDISMKLI